MSSEISSSVSRGSGSNIASEAPSSGLDTVGWRPPSLIASAAPAVSVSSKAISAGARLPNWRCRANFTKQQTCSKVPTILPRPPANARKKRRENRELPSARLCCAKTARQVPVFQDHGAAQCRLPGLGHHIVSRDAVPDPGATGYMALRIRKFTEDATEQIDHYPCLTYSPAVRLYGSLFHQAFRGT